MDKEIQNRRIESRISNKEMFFAQGKTVFLIVLNSDNFVLNQKWYFLWPIIILPQKFNTSF